GSAVAEPPQPQHGLPKAGQCPAAARGAAPPPLREQQHRKVLRQFPGNVERGTIADHMEPLLAEEDLVVRSRQSRARQVAVAESDRFTSSARPGLVLTAGLWPSGRICRTGASGCPDFKLRAPGAVAVAWRWCGRAAASACGLRSWGAWWGFRS